MSWPGRGLIDAGEVRLVLFGSGVTTAPAVAAESLKCSTPGTRRACLGSRKSAVAGRPVWDEAFTANDGVEPELARLLELVESGEQDVALFIEGVTGFGDAVLQMDLVNRTQIAAMAGA